jgi:predicted ATPase
MITALAVENYRSLRHLVVGLRRINVVTGSNGSGKSSLYRALRLLAEASRNGVVSALARQGGLPATLWAGPEHIGRSVRAGTHPVQGTARTGPVSLKLGFATDQFGYAMDLGLPKNAPTAFRLDPEIKREVVFAGPVLRPATTLTDRGGTTVRLRGSGGGWEVASAQLRPYDSMLSELADPQRAPELLSLRDEMRSWRFYDNVRTDPGAPARLPQIGTRTPVLSHDAADLAAALQTIREVGDDSALDVAVDRAFPGSRIEVRGDGGRFELALHQHGLLRPLGGADLSDGTLRYLVWVAALLTPAPPSLLILNEPETSLHPELLPPLADLILEASERTQLIIVTHSRPLAAALDKRSADRDDDIELIELTKDLGETTVVGQGRLDGPPWQWPSR